ncbi:MAG: thermonuclease family protein [Geminicoccales bacterium]
MMAPPAGDVLRDVGLRLLACGVLAAMLTAPAAADEIRGQGTVLSGNEVMVGAQAVRLFGIAAPGLKETCEINDAKMKCGIVAWAELIKLADGQQVSCDSEEAAGAPPAKTEKPVTFATCYIGETDLNEAMVRSGWARAARQQSDRYEVDENDAKESGRGLWSNLARSAGDGR